jgi:hypothetical protein
MEVFSFCQLDSPRYRNGDLLPDLERDLGGLMGGDTEQKRVG